jgi:hypothetical protein
MRMRPEAGQYAAHFEGYVASVPEGDLLQLLREQAAATQAALELVTEEQGAYRYAPGKWSLKEVLGHLADTERVMSYRLLRASRGDETPLAGFSEELFVQGASFDRLSVKQLQQELSAVRTSTLSLLSGLPEEAWSRTSPVNGHATSALALACIILGHEKHHLKVIQERYVS